MSSSGTFCGLVQEAHRLGERRASKTVDVNYFRSHDENISC